MQLESGFPICSEIKKSLCKNIMQSLNKLKKHLLLHLQKFWSGILYA